MPLNGIGQSLDHGFPAACEGGRTGLWPPRRIARFRNLAEPGPAEAIVLQGTVPHGAPDLADSAAVQECFCPVVYPGNPVVDLVRCHIVTVPAPMGPAQGLV